MSGLNIGRGVLFLGATNSKEPTRGLGNHHKSRINMDKLSITYRFFFVNN